MRSVLQFVVIMDSFWRFIRLIQYMILLSTVHYTEIDNFWAQQNESL